MTDFEFAEKALDAARERYLAADAKRTSLQQGGVSNRDHESHELLQMREEVEHWERKVKALSGQGRQISVKIAQFSTRRRGCGH